MITQKLQLLNVGSEELKGNDIIKKAYQNLQNKKIKILIFMDMLKEIK